MLEVHLSSRQFGFAVYVKAAAAESVSKVFCQNKC